MDETTSNGLLITFSGLGSYTASAVQHSGMGQLAASHALAENNITTMAFAHNQVPEAYQAATDYHTGHPDAPIDIAGHSMGADSAIQLANQLGQQDVPVSNLFTISTPPEPMTTPLTNHEIGNVHNFYTTYQDYDNPASGIMDPAFLNDSLIDHAQNIEVGDTHTGVDENPFVQQYIEQTVIHGATETAERVNEPSDETPEYQTDFSTYELVEAGSEPVSDHSSDTDSDSSVGDYYADGGGM